jgi:hypothetical protein
MTRNYFSKKGGPYFVGETFSQHTEVHSKPSNKKDIALFALLSIGAIGILLMVNIVIIRSFN